MPTPTASIIVASSNSRVAGKKRRSSSATACLDVSDVPRSPRASRPMYIAYCTASGRSSPSRSRTASSCSGVACRPAAARAGSPGSRLVSAKVSTLTPSSTGSICNRRRATNGPIIPSTWRTGSVSAGGRGSPPSRYRSSRCADRPTMVTPTANGMSSSHSASASRYSAQRRSWSSSAAALSTSRSIVAFRYQAKLSPPSPAWLE